MSQATTAAPSTAEPSPSPSPIPSTQRTTAPSPSPQPSPTTSQQASPSPPPPTSQRSSASPPPQTSSQQQSPAPTSQAPATTARPDATTTSRGAVVEPSPIVFTSNGATFTSKVPVPTVSGLTSTVSSNNVSNGSSSGSSTGVIIGVVVGIVGVVLLIGGGVLWWRRINKPKSRRYNLDDIFTSPSANAQAPAGAARRPFSMSRTPAAPSSDVNRHEAATSEYSAVPVQSSVDFSQSHVSHHQPQQQAPQFLMADGSNPYMNAQSQQQQQQQQHAQAYYDAATLAYYQQQQAAYYQQYGQYPPADASYDSAHLQYQQQQQHYAAAYANQAASNASQSSTQLSSDEKSSHMFNVYDNANRLSAASAGSTEHSDVALSPPAFIEKERLLKHSERGADANQWTIEEAVAWVTEKEYGDASTVALMKEQEIDGRSLLLLSNNDLEHTLKISDPKRRDRFEDAISELKRNSATLQQAASSGLPSYN
ncbi:hypothetical protein HDU78_001440 [Chytriomyces hyalinus]|nr:hypothetical protein HDU78_001440 [Chytriomyces hyalinus]